WCYYECEVRSMTMISIRIDFLKPMTWLIHGIASLLLIMTILLGCVCWEISPVITFLMSALGFFWYGKSKFVSKEPIFTWKELREQYSVPYTLPVKEVVDD